MLGIGLAETAVILVLAVLLFGRRIPAVGRWLGKNLLEFRKGASDA